MPKIYELNYVLNAELKQNILSYLEDQTFPNIFCSKDNHMHPFQCISTRGGTLVLTPEIQSVVEAVSDMLEPPEGITIIKTLPNTEMGIHTDIASNAHRRTLFISIISPSAGALTALKFYDSEGNVLEEHSYDNGKSILTITNEKHQAVNYTDVPRYSLQMGFSKSIDELITIYES